MQNRQNHLFGITLIEQLLVLSIISIITMAGIQQYMSYRDQQQRAEITADVQRIFSAMRDYFYLHGCDSSGNFQGKLSELDLNTDLHLARLAYHAEIKALSFTNQNNQPLYQFKVSAASTSEIFHSKKERQTLQWNSLPTQQYQNKGSTWIMAEHLRQRKKHSNCAQ